MALRPRHQDHDEDATPDRLYGRRQAQASHQPIAQRRFLMLSKDWNQRKQQYDFIIVGSGYGGALPAARITAATPKPSVCILERGREWEVGKFPYEIGEVVRNARNPTFNPIGLYD